jgi:hypothetical protein
MNQVGSPNQLLLALLISLLGAVRSPGKLIYTLATSLQLIRRRNVALDFTPYAFPGNYDMHVKKITNY